MVAFDPIEYAVPISAADRIRETAVSAARQAGVIQMRHFRKPAVRCTSLLHDVKLETDRLCETAIVAAIRERFPDHAILTEESGELPGPGGYRWIIDPLDGTVNFWHGLPLFCTSIACYRLSNTAAAKSERGLSGAPVVGVVFLPFSRELFCGMPGRGAFLNEKAIRVGRAQSLAEAVVSVSFGKNPETMRRMRRRLDTLLPQVRKARCLGAAAAELAYVAAGFLDGLLYEGIKLWDFAAGKIILEEAGGRLEAAETEPNLWRIAASSPSVLAVLNRLAE